MEINADCVLDVWEFFAEFIPAGKRSDAAIKYVKLFINQDVEVEEFDEIRGEDDYLDSAIDLLAGSNNDLDDNYNLDDE